MTDALTKLVRQKRKAEVRVTHENKQHLIDEINKNSFDYGYGKIKKNASVAEVTRMKNEYLDRLTYDIVTLAIERGNTIIAEIEGRDLKHSKDSENKRLGEFAKQLAKAKQSSNRNLSKEEQQFLERGNNSIKGYGNDNMIKIFENERNPKKLKEQIEEIKNQDAKSIFYKKQTELFERTFQKVGIVRENDLIKLKDKIETMSMKDALNQTNDLLKTLAIFDYQKFEKESVDETEIANARLDDVLIKTGLKKGGSQKVKKTFDKYSKKQ